MRDARKMSSEFKTYYFNILLFTNNFFFFIAACEICILNTIL